MSHPGQTRTFHIALCPMSTPAIAAERVALRRSTGTEALLRAASLAGAPTGDLHRGEDQPPRIGDGWHASSLLASEMAAGSAPRSPPATAISTKRSVLTLKWVYTV